jgi:hypothetical protein
MIPTCDNEITCGNNMLVFQIAAGVLLGLLVYRGLVHFSKSRGMTIPAFLFSILYFLFVATLGLGFVGLLLVGIYLVAVHPETLRQYRSEIGWGVGIFIVLGVVYSVWSDIAERKKSPDAIEHAAAERRLREQEIRRREVYDADWLRSVPRKEDACNKAS